MTAQLTWPIVAWVLFGALLHASWNALVKSSKDKALDTAMIQTLAALVALPMAQWLGWPPAAAWPFLIASTAIHFAYYLALSSAYQHGDLGLTYPLMRGTAPLLVALASLAALGERLSPVAWVGVLGICGGVLVLGLSRHALASPRAVQFALINAVMIALYTLVDALGVRAATGAGGNATHYVLALFVVHGWPFVLYVVARRGLATVGPYVRARWPLGLGGALALMGSYGIALWAMTQAPVATVAALRETSVLFAALLGTWLLKERFTTRRAVGTAAIVAGVMALRIS
jgi:phosphonate utilization associated putative membrane protein